MERKYIVYRATNKINGKMYIGITCRKLKERIWQHKHESEKLDSPTYNTPFKRAIRKYGIDNFNFEILEENLNQLEASKKEIYYIKKFNTYCNYINSNGYNASSGGEFSCGRPKDRVVQMDKITGEKIEIYESISQAEKEVCQGIFECIYKINQTAGNSCWLLEKDYLKMTKKQRKDYVNILCRNIIQFDLNGNIIKIFDGPKTASLELKISEGNISMVLSKQRCSTGGYTFMYYEDYLDNGFNIKKNNQDRSKEIFQLDADKNIINVYQSLTKAAIAVNTKPSNISCSIKRKTKSAGYYWQYKNT